MTTKTSISETIETIIKKLPKDKVLHQFCEIYLGKIPSKSLKKHSIEYITEFIKDRYAFFKEYNHKKGEIKLYKHPDIADKHILEMVFPDAPFTILTLELILKTHNLPITRLHHPIFTVEKNKDKEIIELDQPIEGKTLISYVYAEIDYIEDNKFKKALEKEIEEKMFAVQIAHKDQEKMLTLLDGVKEDIANTQGKTHRFHDEWVDLCDWMKNNNYSFFGYAKYDISEKSEKKSTKLDEESTLGILNLSGIKETLRNILTKHTETLLEYRSPFIFDTIPFESPIQRFENVMRLSIKIKINDTKSVEHNFLGLIKQSSLTVKNLETPIIRKRIENVFENRHILKGSYDYNQIIRICTATPKFELFRTPTEHMEQMIDDLLSITNPNEVYVFTRSRINHSRHFLMIVMPPSLYTDENIQSIKEHLEEKYEFKNIEIVRAFDEKRCRIHIHLDTEKTIPLDQIEKEIRILIKPWEEQLRETLIEEEGVENGSTFFTKYMEKFPDHHKVRRNAKDTIRDIKNIEEMLKTNQTQFRVIPFVSNDSVLAGKSSVLCIYNKEKLDLISIMPTLENLGVHIFDELTTRIGSQENTLCYMHSFRIAHLDHSKLNESHYEKLITSLLENIFKEKTTNDPINKLTVTADLPWRAIDVFKTYRAFYLQLNTRYSREKINQVILSYPKSIGILFKYFETKFIPSDTPIETRLKKELPKIEQEFLESLNQVDEIADDIILKRFFNFIQSTLRTNFYIDKPNGENFISVKFESKNIKLPLPIPYREIFVYDSEMEGCHIRFGAVARGGLRWSNRIDDFRREILGLVKTQQTKNVVIVPVGSKGGFVIKKALKTREEANTESEIQYKKLIRGLLDITDNINKKGQTISPKQVIRYDGNDPYLVVAADKGTANFSDIANGISEEYGFWLGDAFASGGSVGYNHKEVAITAKGAWECVKLHFKELGKDIQEEPFTVAGVGDMSGDVFGNGMLLSPKILLQAAFNHMHIFLDPNPSAELSFKERERMFALPRSTWDDYNKRLISKGGGIFERKAKSIPLSKEIQDLLNIQKDTVNGEELINYILKMNVELLWLGGIGTYIKAKTQTHLDVADPANDAIRINVEECNARVIGEGANLGITQAARNKLSERGIKINTDFIDNSAGVNMSDYEVNIKILLERLLNEGHIKSMENRNTLLAKATNEVTELVLSNNRGQHTLLSMDAIRSQTQADYFHKMIHHYVNTQFLNPIQETIPDQSDLDALAALSKPIPRSVLAVLQAYTKMKVFSEIVESKLVTDDRLEAYYINYFPESLKKKFETNIHKHHLKKEIIATVITNMIVNQAGSTFFFHLEQLTGKSVEEIAKAYLIINEALDCDKFRQKILKSKSSIQTQYKALVEFEELIQTIVTDCLQLPSLRLEFDNIETLRDAEKQIKAPNTLKKETEWLEKGLEKSLATEMGELKSKRTLPDLLYLIRIEKIDAKAAEHIVTELNNSFKFEWMKDKLAEIPATSHWDYSLKDSLNQSIRQQKVNLIKLLVKKHSKEKLGSLSKDKIIETLETTHKETLRQYFDTVAQVQSGNPVTLTQLTVTINRLNTVSL